MAEFLLPAETLPRLPTLPAASPSTPYPIPELNSFRAWAIGQPTPHARLSAAALISLGAGAGLAARELAAITSEDIIIDDDGVLVHVKGPRRRVIPLLQSWESTLLEVLEQTPRTTPLFRPGHQAFYPNIVTNFVARSAGVELKPQSPRLRATWVVTLLSSGAPPRALMEAAGVSSLEALTRYLPFVPAPQPALARFALRYAEL
ncbi:tyrosine-type recombinase/integrase [Plantibacter sp. YIM 135249]|uniref:tyrosine-type recombinase/integrase n=1 Tax=Plantibacter sp. YIM 135249 TaxID=3423918 RepID=UPI003D35512C